MKIRKISLFLSGMLVSTMILAGETQPLLLEDLSAFSPGPGFSSIEDSSERISFVSDNTDQPTETEQSAATDEIEMTEIDPVAPPNNRLTAEKSSIDKEKTTAEIPQGTDQIDDEIETLGEEKCAKEKFTETLTEAPAANFDENRDSNTMTICRDDETDPAPVVFLADDPKQLTLEELQEMAETNFQEGHLHRALGIYSTIIRRAPLSKFAPDAWKKKGCIYCRQHRYQAAFRCFRTVLEKYPTYPGYLDVIGLEFELASDLMRGKRHYFFGKIPGFKDRESAIRYFQDVIDQAPYSEWAPRALINIAKVGMRIKEPEKSIEALERILDEYSDSGLAEEAQLMLAQVYRRMVTGPDYDQRATEEAVNTFREFLILYPQSPRLPEAEAGLGEARELLAASKLNMGDFYYNLRENPRAAVMYYQKVLSIAPDSKAAATAKKRLRAIAQGKRGKGSKLDFLLGRYKGSKNFDRSEVEQFLGTLEEEQGSDSVHDEETSSQGLDESKQQEYENQNLEEENQTESTKKVEEAIQPSCDKISNTPNFTEDSDSLLEPVPTHFFPNN